MLDSASAMADLTFHVFSNFAYFNSDVKPGIHLSTGIGASAAVRASAIYLEYIPEGSSLLAAARKQGVFDIANADSKEKYLLTSDHEANGVGRLLSR